MSFNWPAGGPHSYQALTGLAARHCPVELNVTSTLRSGANDWHGAGYAVDFALPYDHGPGSAAMAQAARWWRDVCGDHLLELIHSAPDSAGGGEYLIKNGQVVSPSFYGWPTINAHENHVHVAATAAAVADLSARLSAGAPSSTPPGTGGAGTVFGWDASNHDWGRGPMDFGSVRRDGIDFLIHKATGAGRTEGGVYRDPYLARALAGGRAAGFPVLGAYHVVCPADQMPIADQVDLFMSTVSAAAPWWREVPWLWQCDAEDWNTGIWPTPAECKAFLDGVRDRSGGHGWTVWYAPKRRYATAPDIGHDLWTPDYHTPGRTYRELYPGDNDPAWAPYAGRTPAIFQYASDATMGNQPMCDANAYRGGLASLIERCGGADMAFFDDPNAAALGWRVDALVRGLDTVAGGPTKGEKVMLRVPDWATVTAIMGGIIPTGFMELTAPTTTASGDQPRKVAKFNLQALHDKVDGLAAKIATPAPVGLTAEQITEITTALSAALAAKLDAVRADVVDLRARIAAGEQAQAEALKAA